jgi:hypothetical protein
MKKLFHDSWLPKQIEIIRPTSVLADSPHYACIFNRLELGETRVFHGDWRGGGKAKKNKVRGFAPKGIVCPASYRDEKSKRLRCLPIPDEVLGNIGVNKDDDSMPRFFFLGIRQESRRCLCLFPFHNRDEYDIRRCSARSAPNSDQLTFGDDGELWIVRQKILTRHEPTHFGDQWFLVFPDETYLGFVPEEDEIGTEKSGADYPSFWIQYDRCGNLIYHRVPYYRQPELDPVTGTPLLQVWENPTKHLTPSKENPSK